MVEVQKEVPVSVRIISILFFVVSVVLFFSTIVYVYNFFLVTAPLPVSDGLSVDVSSAGGMMLAVMIPGVILFMGIAILSFFIGMGLWRGKNWARIAALVLSLLIVLSSIVGIIYGKMNNIFGLILFLIVARHLWFNERLKAFFLEK